MNKQQKRLDLLILIVIVLFNQGTLSATAFKQQIQEKPVLMGPLSSVPGLGTGHWPAAGNTDGVPVEPMGFDLYPQKYRTPFDGDLHFPGDGTMLTARNITATLTVYNAGTWLWWTSPSDLWVGDYNCEAQYPEQLTQTFMQVWNCVDQDPYHGANDGWLKGPTVQCQDQSGYVSWTLTDGHDTWASARSCADDSMWGNKPPLVVKTIDPQICYVGQPCSLGAQIVYDENLIAGNTLWRLMGSEEVQTGGLTHTRVWTPETPGQQQLVLYTVEKFSNLTSYPLIGMLWFEVTVLPSK